MVSYSQLPGQLELKKKTGSSSGSQPWLKIPDAQALLRLSDSASWSEVQVSVVF